MPPAAPAVKSDVPVIADLPGFYSEAWTRASRAQDEAGAVVDLLGRLYSPPSDVIAVAKLAEDSARLLRVVIERARVGSLGRLPLAELPR